jgi:transcriptional regulator with XRE-family HTH domain
MNFNLSLSDAAVLKELGNRLAQYRLNQNLTQEALAYEAGISLRTLTRIENGAPSQTSNLLRVLRVLGLLDNLDALVPAPAVSPIEQLKLKGKVRQRASSPAPAHVAEPWVWGTAAAEAASAGPDGESSPGEGADPGGKPTRSSS